MVQTVQHPNFCSRNLFTFNYLRDFWPCTIGAAIMQSSCSNGAVFAQMLLTQVHTCQT